MLPAVSVAESTPQPLSKYISTTTDACTRARNSHVSNEKRYEESKGEICIVSGPGRLGLFSHEQ